MLTEMFGMEWYKVHDEAEHLEHAVSDDFEQRLVAVLGTGKTCPTAIPCAPTPSATAANATGCCSTRYAPPANCSSSASTNATAG